MKHYSLFALIDAVSGTVSVCESLAAAEELAFFWKAEMLDLAFDSYEQLKSSFEEDHPEESFKSFEEYLKDTDQNNGDLQIFEIAENDQAFETAKALLKNGNDATGKLNNSLTNCVESIYLWQPTYTLCRGDFESQGYPSEQEAIDAGLASDFEGFSFFTSATTALNALKNERCDCHQFKPNWFSGTIYFVKKNDIFGETEIVDIAEFRNAE